MPFEREYRELSFVPRWGIVRTIKPQSVAEHSFYVALYAGQVADLIKWQGDRAALLKYALYHDMSEVFMSDIPGPVKRATMDNRECKAFVEGELSRRFDNDWCVEVDDEICNIVKVADLLDEIFFLASEIQMGNGTLSGVFANTNTRLSIICSKINADLYHKLLPHISSHEAGQSIIVEG